MKRILIFAALAACTVLTACVKPEDVRTLDNRVYEQKLRIDELEGKVEQATQVDSEKADLWAQVQSMRQELAQTRSELEALQKDVAGVHEGMDLGAKALDTLGEDVKDVKIGWQRLNSQLGADVDLAAIRAERMIPPAAQPQPDGVNATLPGGPEAGPAGESSTAADTPNASAPDQTAAQVTADAASTLYKSARSSFEASDYRQGVALWDEFVSSFPEHRLVPNALFWQGECYYQMKDYARAVLKYQVVIDKYKKSTKYPTALLKQGISFMRLGRVKAGKLLLKDVVKQFPQAPEGKRAATILKQVK
ncbi:tol-pal system protein YbgF [Desulfocurvus sp. DL9XJH121]